MASLIVTLRCETLRDEAGNMSVVRCYIADKPDTTLAMFGIAPRAEGCNDD